MGYNNLNIQKIQVRKAALSAYSSLKEESYFECYRYV